MIAEKIAVIDGTSTPVDSFGGLFKDVPSYELCATAVQQAVVVCPCQGLSHR